ncbi:MAG TPA: hypothetical protein VLG92_05885 [Candidatus Saccharimonadia bacterium]|nr:hypothetical protein [Candidatus Saccharimonadia bacterium]
MFSRKNKKLIEQGRTLGRQVQRGGAANPAFSYYNKGRTAEVPRERLAPQRQQLVEPQEQGRGRGASAPRSMASALPFWLLTGLVTACVIKVLWLSTDPRVIIVGNTTTSSVYAESAAKYELTARTFLAGSVANRSKITADLDGTARKLEHAFPELAQVTVSIPLVSNRPVVYAEIAQPSLTLQMSQGNYALNKAGVVLARTPKVAARVPVVVDQSSVAPKLGTQYLPSSAVSFIQTVEYQLRSAHMTIDTFVLPPGSPYELDVHLSSQAFLVRFNLEENALVQSGSAIATIQHLTAEGNLPKAYLDVRVPGRVYYK